MKRPNKEKNSLAGTEPKRRRKIYVGTEGNPKHYIWNTPNAQAIAYLVLRERMEELAKAEAKKQKGSKKPPKNKEELVPSRRMVLFYSYLNLMY